MNWFVALLFVVGLAGGYVVLENVVFRAAPDSGPPQAPRTSEPAPPAANNGPAPRRDDERNRRRAA